MVSNAPCLSKFNLPPLQHGRGIQKNIYTGAALSRLSDRTLINLVKCPQTQCEEKSPMCRESIECMKRQPKVWIAQVLNKLDPDG